VTSVRIVPVLEDHLWYPILVKAGGGHVIRELQGKGVNEWNEMVRRQDEADKNRLRQTEPYATDWIR
jgi:hypothetical protein